MASATRKSAVFAVVRCLSIYMSVRQVRVLYPEGWRYRQTSFSTS